MLICFREKEKQVITEIITTNKNKTSEREKKINKMKSMVILALKLKYKVYGIFSFIFTQITATDA
jgi:hypothetical protein